MTEDEIDQAYYRILNGWHTMSRQAQQIALIELRVLKAESASQGKACHEELEALSHLEKQILRALRN